MTKPSKLSAARIAIYFLSCICIICQSPPVNAQWGDKAKAEKTAKIEKAAKPGKGAPVKKTPAKLVGPQIPWLVNCASTAGRMACEASQRLTIQKTGQLLLSVVVRIPPKSKSGSMLLHLPHGMYLPAGILMTIDGKAEKKQPVQTCDEKGCYVGLPINNKLLKSLQTGKSLSIAFKNLQKKDITIPISLSGFKEAYKKLL